jgi:hypothetical protein
MTHGSASDRFDIGGGVARSSGEILVLSVRDVKVGLGVTELLGETEIDGIDLISTLSNAHEEVVRFDIAINEVSRVDIFGGVGGCGTCHSSLFIPHCLPSLVMQCYSLPSRNVGRKPDVRVGLIDTAFQNTLYSFERFWGIIK